MKIGEANALVVELVQVRRLEDRIAVAGKVAIALVIGQHDEHIGMLRRRRRGCRRDRSL